MVALIGITIITNLIFIPIYGIMVQQLKIFMTLLRERILLLSQISMAVRRIIVVLSINPVPPYR